MLSSQINFNPSIMTTTLLRTQCINRKSEQSVEQKSIYAKQNNEVSNKTELKRILPENNVNVMYIASAFQKSTTPERKLKSLWL